MGMPKLGLSSKEEQMHYSVGAILEKDGKYLLIDRANLPYGFAGPAGHVEKGENEQYAIYREILEETGLELTRCELVLEKEVNNLCRRGTGIHYWYLFRCEVKGHLKLNRKEVKSAGWYYPEEIKQLNLEPIWNYWFRELSII